MLLAETVTALKELSPLTLAFIGDSVFDLLVKEKLIAEREEIVSVLHNKVKEKVKCQSQAVAADKILPLLTEKELSVFKRGKNAHTVHIPRNATRAEYHNATGLEALFGYLYLSDNLDRLKELFNLIMNE